MQSNAEKAVGPGNEALGTILETAGRATGLKGLIKYAILFIPLYLRRQHGDPLHNDEIATLLEPGWFNLGYPFSIFVQHVNSISLGQAGLESVLFVVIPGMVLNAIGKKMRGDKNL